ncbi:MAG TPA: molecular chaperone HtpG [Gemmataceae bacterium]|jgi:molecular chaperone HtpG|nr:molecular chaperone HtpG [Gemmataceae bacterium]
MSAETLQFRTELKQILDIIVHSLYSHKDIFLRELISNASDAIDTLRFQSLTRPELVAGDPEWKIKVIPDESAGTLTVADNGIGMSRESIIDNLGTIAKSGTRAFLETLKQADAKDRPELIGQFGVGFYSSFMVADKVTVVSRQAGDPANQGVRWESDGQGEFAVETVDKSSRGTDVILHIRQEDREFLKEWKLRELVRKYSDFVEHPIVMDAVEGDDKKIVEETLNSRKAIWLRPKADISAEDYNEFYKHLSHDFEPPAQVIHFSAEGAVEFRALLYLPAHKPFDLQWGDTKKGLQLYIRRVFIMDDCEALLPPYLRFVKGVVDSPDLPLNVSREMLQQSAPLEKIRSNLVNKVLRTLGDTKKEEYDRYVSFFKELGLFLKEGVCQDRSNREQIADLLLLESTRTASGKFTTLQGYVDGMPAEQKEIYYLIGENREMLQQSPYLEAFKAKGQEVLLLTEPIDEFVVQSLTEYKGKKLRAVDKGDVAGAEVDGEKQKRFRALLDFMKEKIGDVKEVRLSNRLKESAACLVAADERAVGAHMERLMQRLGREGEVPPSQRVLELNPDHAAVDAVQKLHAKNPADPRLEKYSRILYDQAVLAEGSRVKDPADFARRINELVAKDAAS